MRFPTKDRPRSRWAGTWEKRLVLSLLALTMAMLCSCASSPAGGPQQSATLSGNWQFTTFVNPDPNYPPNQPYGLQGGFLLQASGSITGQAVYSVSNFNGPTAGVCNAGSAALTSGTLSGQSVSLTYVAGSQTFSLTGTMSSNGSTISGTYTATQGTASDGTTVCGIGTTQSGPQQWTAVLVPPLTGTVQGFFHSTGGGAGLFNQDFSVSGTFTQGENIGASNATVTGTLTFINPETNLSNYPCFSQASVNGQISGNSVILQIIGLDGSNLGQIGGVSGSGVNPVSFDSTLPNGYALHSVITPGYAVITKVCPGGGGLSNPGDSGNVCLALNGTTTCQQAISFSPAAITFPSQILNVSSTQTATLTFNSAQSGVYLSLGLPGNGGFSYGVQENYSDFNGLANFQAQDNCVPGGETLLPLQSGSTFSPNAGQSCQVTVTFAPQEGCPWLPFGTAPSGLAPEYCPFPLSATLSISGVESPDDSDTSFLLPITGIGLSAIQPSTPELDFGAEEALNPPEASLPQTLSFTNNSSNPVQILGRSSSTCTNPLPRPLQEGSASGLQVVASPPNAAAISVDGRETSINYNCDSDPGTLLPNFQISSDTCTGNLLAPQASCSVQVTYVPQPKTNINSGLDYFLQLNTLQCTNSPDSPPSPRDCEIDSGRFPVELKANGPSPLRMSPSAGLDFGNQAVGTSAALAITLLNDPNLAQTVTFVGKILVSGNYSESDDCPVTLAPGNSCTVTVTFKPSVTGFLPGQLTITYSPEPFGAPQVVYLRGTGQ